MSRATKQLVTADSFSITSIEVHLPNRIRTGWPDPKADVLTFGTDGSCRTIVLTENDL